MDRLLETAGLASVSGWFRRRRRKDDVEFTPGAPCANCATPLQGPWCHACGQSGEDFHHSIWKLLIDGFESLFHADSRIWRTLPDLTLHPGRLTRSYLDGHRAPQVPPFRMFLIILLLVFFAGHLATKGEGGNQLVVKETSPAQAAKAAEAKKEIAGAKDEMTRKLGPAAGANFAKRMSPLEAQLDRQVKGRPAPDENSRGVIVGGVPVIHLDGNEKASPLVDRWVQTRIAAIKANPQQFGLVLEIWAHRVAILALPISALLMSLVYVFQRRFYMFDHMVFSMHSLSFQLLLLTAIFLLSIVVGNGAWWLSLLAPVHLFFHMRGTYGSSWWGTLLRMLILFAGTVVAFSALAVLWVVLGANAMLPAH
ncbi:MAG: DUF3667 domain-containing protein [Caulobacteraceae bacterium]